MNEILFTQDVLFYLIGESILYVALFLVMLATPKILLEWDFEHFTTKQFKLENLTYLVATIITLVLLLKILLLPYFVYTIDKLSILVPGAMCGAGVLSANDSGSTLLILKIAILFVAGFWMSLNHADLIAKNYPYIRIKIWLFITLFVLFSSEMALNILYFAHIQTTAPVSCCSVIFGQNHGANPLPFGLDTPRLLMLFFLLYMLLVLMSIIKFHWGIIIVSLLFLLIAYYSVVYFFGIYIYELPTHKCPFCMLQSDYYYVGYAIWGLLLLGVYLSLDTAFAALFLNQYSSKRAWQYTMILTLFVLLCSSYVVVYYIRNGVLL